MRFIRTPTIGRKNWTVSSWNELTSRVRKSRLRVWSATAQRGTPMLPAAMLLRWAWVRRWWTSSVVVVLPLVPVMARLRQSDCW